MPPLSEKEASGGGIGRRAEMEPGLLMWRHWLQQVQRPRGPSLAGCRTSSVQAADKVGGHTRCVSMCDRGLGRRDGEGCFSSQAARLERGTGVGIRPMGLHPVTQVCGRPMCPQRRVSGRSCCGLDAGRTHFPKPPALFQILK
uniref:Uncharacterized protein n=1 Tax=Pipistrellus kuhlii TaxID=59472 RepID=A0A7J7UAE1_PIPKU|nr:hypothetical protein mPipKuh1_009166 [Pipistrellus kuhlii]